MMKAEVSIHGTIMRFSIFGLLYHFREYTVPAMVVIVAYCICVCTVVASVMFLVTKHDEWKNRPRVKTGPMPYTGIYR